MFQNGQILNDTYEIEGQIGSGGTSTVFRAKHIRLQKEVVIKQIDTDVKTFGQSRAEVDILKSLSHRYLPQVYDYFECDGEIYTVIDYIQGINLQQYIEAGNVPTTKQLISWMRQLCEALEYLHDQKPPIIHSDIKPANVMLKANGEVCLIDFNVSLAGVNGFEMSGFTRNYGSPEQYQYAMSGGKANVKIDKRTDIYSLGATFYFLMARTAPICIPEELISIQDYELPYPESLVDIVDKMMSPRKEQRFNGAQKIIPALNGLMKQDKRWKRFKFVLGIGRFLEAVLLLCGLLVFFYGFSLMQVDAFYEKSMSFVTQVRQNDIPTREVIESGEELMNSFSGKIALYRKEHDYSAFYECIADAENQAGDYELADVYYHYALEFERLESYSHYVNVLIDRGDYQRAKEYLSQAINKGMELGESCYIRGVLKERSGDWDGALMEYKKALMVETDTDRSQKIEAAIERLVSE